MISPINEITTKQRIMECAANLFAEKGFTETTIRELAKVAGFKNPASIYSHFSSKYDILEQMLEEYTRDTDIFRVKDIPKILENNPTPEGVLECYQTTFPNKRLNYYLNVLNVLLQEQLRTPIMRDFMVDHIIRRAEVNTKTVIDVLIDLKIIREDTDADYWMKSVSCLLYTFAARTMLGIGDTTPEFIGKGMHDMLRYTFELLFDSNGIADARNTSPGEARS